MDEKIIDKVNIFTERVKKMLSVKMVILYGSYAKGIERENSDIDVAIVVDDLNDNWLKVNSKLFLISAEIDSNIEPNLIVLKDYKSDFLQSIMKYGKIIYKAA
ncbi:MAG: nucleotidyltransferase domain-containing protein [Spirochaetes bacterium]|nr:nucleotidyltransferase domain-containing protein [Spirochaetota bacterium]